MSDPERDTRYRGFAKLLWEEMQDHAFGNEFEDRSRVGPQYTEHMQKLIACRAYDLVVHTIVELSCQDALDFSNPEFDKYEYTTSEMVEIIPDLTELPKAGQ